MLNYQINSKFSKQHSNNRINKAKEFLTRQLTGLGFDVYPSAANFLVVQVGVAAAWRERLTRRGLFVRDCASFGMPDCLRIGIRAMSDCERLVEGFKREYEAEPG